MATTEILSCVHIVVVRVVIPAILTTSNITTRTTAPAAVLICEKGKTMPNRAVTCGDCIHADICKQLNGGWFSRENIAYCKAFKDRTNVVEVVRCKDCKHNVANKEHDPLDITDYTDIVCDYWMNDGNLPDDFCSYGERKDDGE